MGKNSTLWEYVRENGTPSFQRTFDEIGRSAGVPLDHSFLAYKQELTAYGSEVGKISLKKQTVTFHKLA